MVFLYWCFAFQYTAFSGRALTNSSMLPVCFLLPIKRLFLLIFLLSFSCVLDSFSFFFFSSFVETNTPWQQKVLHIINTSFFLRLRLLLRLLFFSLFSFSLLRLLVFDFDFFPLCPCVSECEAFFLLFLSSTLFELRCCLFDGERQFLLLFMNE